ncbi:MAG: DUF192 domain-containing protein [Idiomarina sp.]|nr:DUF192 domain-containing protein [Idiomarina sp.]
MNTFSLVSLRGTMALTVLAGILGCAPMSANGDNTNTADSDDDGANLCLLTARAYQQDATQRADSAVMIKAELAVNDAQRSRGLMHREHLGADEGMLFYYPRSDYRGFWMFQTLIVLDIAFIDDDGRISQIKTMEPCMSSNPRHCPGYQSNSAARAALELNGGAFADFGIMEGDYVLERTCEQAPWAEGW